jgi:hypothetical protein
MHGSRREGVSAARKQRASILLLADRVWPFEAVANRLRALDYATWIARDSEEARMQLSAPGCGVDVVVAHASSFGEDCLGWLFEAAPTRPSLRALVILDLERCSAPLVIAWQLARLPNVTSMIELPASPRRIVSQIAALLSQAVPSPRVNTLDGVA